MPRMLATTVAELCVLGHQKNVVPTAAAELFWICSTNAETEPEILPGLVKIVGVDINGVAQFPRSRTFVFS